MIEEAKRRSTSGSTLAAAMVIHACVGGRAGIDVPSIVAKMDIIGEVEKEVVEVAVRKDKDIRDNKYIVVIMRNYTNARDGVQ